MSNTQTVPTWQLHHRLALALEASGVTPEQMAQEIGVHVNSIHNYAAGRRVPKLAVVKLWADVCQINRAWLISGQSDTPTDIEGYLGQEQLFDTSSLLSHLAALPAAA